MIKQETFNLMLFKRRFASSSSSSSFCRYYTIACVHQFQNRQKSDFLSHLYFLYTNMLRQKPFDSVSTSKLMHFIQQESAIFQRDRHQDSHEFYIWLMSKIDDQTKQKGKQSAFRSEYFSQRITRTQCLACHTITQREEEEIDLSLNIPQANVSLTHCIRNYSKAQLMTGKNKFKCDKCGELQQAEKRTLLKTLPKFLSIHLRRFKYDETKKSMSKMTCLVPFPFILSLSSLKESSSKYQLVGVVAHLGQGQNYGHYICYILISKKWYCFNDDQIKEVEDTHLQSLWGYKGITKCAYMLFYSLI